MKKFLLLCFFPFVVACTRTDTPHTDNYMPEIQQLASDIMIPEVLWSLGWLGSLQVSPDGKFLAWESMERDGYESDKNRLFVANLETEEKTDFLVASNQNVQSLSWDAEGKIIYFISDIPAQFLYFPKENHWVLQAQTGIVWQHVFF